MAHVGTVRDYNHHFEVAGYVFHSEVVISPVRIAKSGNIVTLDTNDVVRGTVRATILEAQADYDLYWQRQSEREKNCKHNWQMITHDERECSKCGAIEVVPDL
jgi:hypothetical protein